MRVLAMLIALAVSFSSVAAQPALSINAGGDSKEYSATALLGRSDVISITVQDDVSYRRSMTYRAVPLLALLQATHDDRFDTLEAHAADGFVAQIPLELVTRGASGGAVAYLAVEDPAHPWAALPNEKKSAGPFYLVWDHPQRSDVRAEQWPYAFAEYQSRRESGASLAAAFVTGETFRRRGGTVGAESIRDVLSPVSSLNGAGVAQVGPDLGRPMNVTQYLTEAGLRAIVRNPAAVRTWPQQRMTGFGSKTLPDADLDALVAYLQAMGSQPGEPVSR